jgi:hypothetical protein
MYGACGGGIQAPFGSVLSIYGWAADNWNRLDGIFLYRTGRSIGGLSGPELVNLAYAYLTDGRDAEQIKALDMVLAPVDVRERMVAEDNMAAMTQLAAMTPPRKKN